MAHSFDLVVRNIDGTLQTRRLEAADREAAVRQGEETGGQVLSCSAMTRHGLFARSAAVREVRSAVDVVVFAQEFSSLIGAGLSVVEALSTLAQAASREKERSVLAQVSKRVQQGESFSAALAAVGGFPPLMVSTVMASEQTGDLSKALLRYAEYQQNLKFLKDKVSGAAVYPALLLVVGLLVVIFLMGVVVPKFATLIESTRGELPWSSRLLLSWGRYVSAHTLQVSVVGAAMLFVLGQLIRQGARRQWYERLPLIGKLSAQFRRAQTYRTAAMLVRGGIVAPKALALSANLLGERDRLRLRKAIALLHEGHSISSALKQTRLADSIATSMLLVAERTGNLADMLDRVAMVYESKLNRAIDLTSRLFEPFLMIAIGLVIGTIVLLMYLPIFDLAASLQ